MQVGGMGGAGASAASGSSAQVSAAPSSAGVSGDSLGSGQGSTESSAGGMEINNNISIENHNSCQMSTQDFMQLGSVGESQGSELDLQKLIEMLMLIKLLEAFNQQSGAA